MDQHRRGPPAPRSTLPHVPAVQDAHERGCAARLRHGADAHGAWGLIPGPWGGPSKLSDHERRFTAGYPAVQVAPPWWRLTTVLTASRLELGSLRTASWPRGQRAGRLWPPAGRAVAWVALCGRGARIRRGAVRCQGMVGAAVDGQITSDSPGLGPVPAHPCERPRTRARKWLRDAVPRVGRPDFVACLASRLRAQAPFKAS